MVEAMHGAGTQTVKVRGGMAFLGATRIYGLYRVANSLALSDAKIRGVKPEEAVGARGWDSYSWHTDLPPGHPMVTGAQTNDFDLFAVEHSKLCVVWGMNWITTKMPDSHWLTEARLKGTKVVAVTVEYSATASKADDVIIIRPGTDPAFALGLAQVIVSRRLYDEAWVRKNTDLPFLVRMDDLTPLRPEDVDASYAAQPLKNIAFVKAGEKPTPVLRQRGQLAGADMASEFGAFMVWDRSRKAPAVVTRDDAGVDAQGVDAQLRYRGKVKLKDGRQIEVRTSFDLHRPVPRREHDARAGGEDHRRARQGCGGPGRGDRQEPRRRRCSRWAWGPTSSSTPTSRTARSSWSLRSRGTSASPAATWAPTPATIAPRCSAACPATVMEDPFEPQLDPKAPAKSRKALKYESLHYFNYGDRPLRGRKQALHRRRPRAHAHQGDVAEQLQLRHRQREVALRCGRQHPAEAGAWSPTLTGGGRARASTRTSYSRATPGRSLRRPI
jgi:nitrate reductase alpha subunit